LPIFLLLWAEKKYPGVTFGLNWQNILFPVSSQPKVVPFAVKPIFFDVRL